MSNERLHELLRKRQTAGLSQDEAAELGRLLAQTPHRPDEAPRSPDQWVKPGTPWERAFAIVGIVFAFPFLLTIPGWIGIDHYRKWQNYERPRPTGFIAWGILWTALFSIGLVASVAVNLSSGPG